MSDGATADGASRGPRRRVVVILAALGVAGGAIGWALRGRTPATEVSGTVTSDGRPVVFGTVTLLAVDRRAYSAAIGADGRFTVSNVPPGPVQIAVSSPDPTAPAGAMARGQRDTASPLPSRPTAAAPGQGAGADAVDPPPGTTIAAPLGATPLPAEASPPRAGWFRIPGRYASPATSGLGATLEPGGNRVDLRVD